ncbi:MAG: ADP-ribosylglycohydrolase family protein, partial [Clostridia bacterium]|nr:ADP-ribosylglycohydrolase family protein [Clostridia bacterium]
LKELTYKVTAVTHNHPEGLKGAEAIAICIWFARQGKSKEFIKEYIEKNYYKLDFDYDELVRAYKFDETCQGSVPQSIFAFLISDSYEDTIRTAISMGGDADTMACISGAIAEAYYGLPKEIEKEMYRFLSPELKEIVEEFKNRGV